jgi:NADPH:quinone reductase-like Zn-dependent oxidoreductase
MYALVSRASDPTPAVEEVESPALGPADVRVRVAAAGFTLFDAFVAGDHATLGLPDVIGLGFDFSGTVLDVGPEVTGLKPGDRVAGMHADVTAPSRAHASEVVVPARAVALVPDGLAAEEAASVVLSALTARQALDLLGPQRGRLLVTGAAGSVGGWAVALAARDGWAVDALVRPGAEEAARSAGASAVLTEPPGPTYDAVLDAAALQEAAIGAVRDGGRFVGVKPGRDVPAERGIAVRVVLTQPDGASLGELLPLAATGGAPVRIAARRPLAEAGTAYAEAMAAPGSAGRWLLVP